MRLITIAVLLVMTLGMAQAEPRLHNYVLRRQQALASLETPALRMNYGRRQVDYYRAGNGVWLLFEGEHMVGIRKDQR